ncbi:unnamed protein product [Schistosoma curassoni]|uniref:Uncharacterized protein n=1 Tax=Schistosoma curassoni TaxID=6186 RepID=A0A183L1E3_9TREM|nr:unnamed protein product [Schistosoma curassoni]
MRQINKKSRNLAGKYNKPKKPIRDGKGKPITEIQEQIDETIWETLEWASTTESTGYRSSTYRPSCGCHSINEQRNQDGHRANQEWQSSRKRQHISRSTEVKRRSNCRHASPSIQEDLGGTNADGLERMIPHQETKERRSEQI